MWDLSRKWIILSLDYGLEPSRQQTIIHGNDNSSLEHQELTYETDLNLLL